MHTDNQPSKSNLHAGLLQFEWCEQRSFYGAILSLSVDIEAVNELR